MHGAVGLGFGLAASGANIQFATTNPAEGFGSAVNLQINATVSANALTVALKTNAGTDASATNPILIGFRDSTLANGGPLWRTVTAALSVVVPSAQALGTANAVPFRLWLVALDNAGTVELALVNCVVGAASPTQIFGLAENTLITTTAIAAAPSAAVFYSATARTSKAFRILGYVEYAAGLATAGTYASAPTTLQLFGSGIKKPGEVVQTVQNGTRTGSSTTSTTNVDVTNGSAVISPTSAVNLVRATASAAVVVLAGGAGVNTQWQGNFLRGATVLLSGVTGVLSASGTNQQSAGGFAGIVYDAPFTTAATTYKLQQSTSNAAGAASCSSVSVLVEEVMA